MLSVCYKYRDPENLTVWNAILYFNRASADTRRRFTQGLGRILCIPCVILSAVGWCVYIDGEFNHTFWPVIYNNPTLIIPPLCLLAALLHAGCASTVMGVFTAILNILFLSFMGNDIAFTVVSLREFEGTNLVSPSLSMIISMYATMISWF